MILFIFGIFLSIIGWFFNHASHFKLLMLIISKNTYRGLNALDFFAKNPGGKITSEHPAFEVILKRFEKPTNKDSVKFIRRGPAYTKFSSEVSFSFALVACDDKGDKIEPPSEASFIRNELLKEQEKRLFIIGTVVFFLGITISAITGIIEFLEQK